MRDNPEIYQPFLTYRLHEYIQTRRAALRNGQWEGRNYRVSIRDLGDVRNKAALRDHHVVTGNHAWLAASLSILV
jgi:hypothetical protein